MRIGKRLRRAPVRVLLKVASEARPERDGALNTLEQFMKRLIPLFFVLFGGASAFACGSDSGSDGGACAPADYRAQVTAACVSCVESSCSTQYQALCNAHCNSGAAGSGQLSSDCSSAVQAVGECADQKCSVCVPDDTGASGSTGTGGTGNGTGGSGTATGGTHSGGTTSSGGSSSGGTTSTSGTGRACTIGGFICNWYPASTPASAVDMQCTQSGGAISDHCASANLSGCCATPSATICYYQMASSSALESACTQAGGTWGTTPP